MTTWKQNQRIEALTMANAQSAITRCAFCKWKYRGLVVTGKKLFKAHAQKHRAAA